MALLIDLAASNARLSENEFAAWAPTYTVFISSEMQDLAPERAALAAALRTAGLQVVVFEDLGGRDEGAEVAYLEGVARSDIYVGVVADRYGTMLSSGRSPTHAEYLYARELGKRISFWVAQDGSNRQGHARDFVGEVRVFHTTGGFADASDLATRVVERIREIAADDEAPWVKVGDAIFRARRLLDQGDRVEIEADLRDQAIARYLTGLRPDTWNRHNEVQITTADNSGKARIENVTVETTSSSARTVTLAATVDWHPPRGGREAGTGGLTSDDIVEAGLRVGLFGDALPSSLQVMSFMAPTEDPLEPMAGLQLSPAVAEHVARLLIVEHLVGCGLASSVERFAFGPPHRGTRRIELAYTDRKKYANTEPARRAVEGSRSSDA